MIQNIKTVFKNDFFKNVVTLFSGAVIAQLITFAVLPILTRIYTPTEFGVFNIFLSISAVLSCIATGAYEQSILLPKDDKDAYHLVLLNLGISVIYSSLLLVIFLFIKDFLLNFFSETSYGYMVYLIPIIVFVQAVYRVLVSWENRKKGYKKISAANIVKSSSTVGVQYGLGETGMGSLGLIWGSVAGQGVSVSMILISSLKELRIYKKITSVERIKILAKRYSNFPKFTMFSSLLYNVSVHVPIFILTSFFSKTIVGLYSVPHRILSVPLNLVSSSISQVYLQQMAIKKNDEGYVRKLTFDVYKKLLMLSIIPFSLIMVYGDILFFYIFGEEWGPSGVYAQVLAPWLMFVFATSPITMIFVVKEMQKKRMLINLVFFIVRLSALLIGALIYKDSLITISLYALTGFVFWFFYTLYVLALAKVKIINSLKFTLIVISVGFLPILISRIVWGV